MFMVMLLCMHNIDLILFVILHTNYDNKYYF